MLADPKTAPITDAEKAMFVFLEKVNHDAARIGRPDIETLLALGWTEEAIYDAISVCALFNFYNRWIDATGVQDMPAAMYEMSGKRMATGGYTKDDDEKK